MQIYDNLTVQPIGPSGLLAAQTSAWQVGQLLAATVVEALGAGQLSLRINGQLLTAQTQLALKPGATLTLQVMSSGEQPTLAVVESPVEPDTQLQAWRVALPLQEPLPPLLNTVVALASAPEGSPTTPGQAIASIAGQILGSLSDIQAVVHPSGLKAAIVNSGLFLETRLSAAADEGRDAAGIAVTDFKAGLLRLASALRAAATAPALVETDPGGGTVPTGRSAAVPAQSSTPAAALTQGSASALPGLQHPIDASAQALIRQTGAALARLQLNQLSSLPAEHGGTSIWALDLPVHCQDHIDVLRLRVEADERRGGPEGPRSWSVVLDLEPSNLGPVHARLTLNGVQVSTTVWAERPDTAALFANHLDELRVSMAHAGLAVATIGCYCGKAPAPGHSRMPDNLLDTRA